VLALFVVVSLACKTASDSLGDVGRALHPDVLVEVYVDTDVFGAHLLESKALDGLDSLGSSELAALSMDSLVHVDGVLASDDLLDGRSLLLAVLFHHFV